MMTDEDTPDSKHINSVNPPEVAEKKGQMLVIYLPEGSVIVDRTDVNLSTAPQAILEHIMPKAEEKVVEPVVEEAPVQQMQPTLQEVVQLAVAEVMRITEKASTPIQRERPAAPIQKEQPTVAQIPQTNVNESAPFSDYAVPFTEYPAPAAKNSAPTLAPATTLARQVRVRRRRKINWVHGVNTVLVGYLLLAAIVPAVLSSAFGTAVYASQITRSGVLIAKGDLMVCKELPASQLQVNDVLLVRDGNSWRLDARQVTSNVTTGALSTVTTSSTGGAAVDETYVLAKDARSYQVTRVIPKLGYVAILFSSIYVKVLGGLFILILNLIVHIRRSRRGRLVTAIR
jgi:hypothetical protein